MWSDRVSNPRVRCLTDCDTRPGCFIGKSIFEIYKSSDSLLNAVCIMNMFLYMQLIAPVYVCLYTNETKLTLKTLNKNCSGRHFIFFTFIFEENKV